MKVDVSSLSLGLDNLLAFHRDKQHGGGGGLSELAQWGALHAC